MNDEQIFEDEKLDDLIRQVLTDYYMLDQRIAKYEEEAKDCDYVFSERHEQRMKELFAIHPSN